MRDTKGMWQPLRKYLSPLCIVNTIHATSQYTSV